MSSCGPVAFAAVDVAAGVAGFGVSADSAGVDPATTKASVRMSVLIVSMSLLCGLPGRVFPAGLAEEVLADQVFEHDRVLHELDLRTVAEEFLRATGRDTDVLANQQARGKYARIAV